jgi:hypothetical protein
MSVQNGFVNHRDGTRSEVKEITFEDGTQARVQWNSASKQFVAGLPESPDQMVISWLHLSGRGKWTDVAFEPRRVSEHKKCSRRYCPNEWVTWGYAVSPRSGKKNQITLCGPHREEEGIPAGEISWLMQPDGTIWRTQNGQPVGDAIH